MWALTRATRGTGLPILVVDGSSYETATRVRDPDPGLPIDDLERIEAVTAHIADALDASWLESLPSSARSRRLSPAAFRHRLVEQARAVGACLVLSEGTDLASNAAGLITANVITLRLAPHSPSAGRVCTDGANVLNVNMRAQYMWRPDFVISNRACVLDQPCRLRLSGGMMQAGAALTACLLLEGVMANLSSVLDQAAADHGERPAVRLDNLVVSYEELRDAAGRVASLLSSLGIEPGDRVAVMLPNVPAFPIVFYGALGAGAIVVPMNPLLKSREVAYYLGDSGAKVLFAWHEVAVEAAKGAAGTGAQVLEVDEPDLHGLLAGLGPAPSMADQAGDDDAVILYTSGTTGRPKGAELTHANLTRNAQLGAVTMLDAGPGDVTMGCLPLFHVFGLTCGLNATIKGGGTLTLLPRFDAGKALELIGRDKVTIFEGVPTMYAAMLHHPARATADTSSLRTCISGGASMPVEIMRGFEQTFGCVILEAYGLSETSPIASFNHPDNVRKPGSIGTPMEGVEMRVVDADGGELPIGEAGEIAIRGHNVMKGYWGKPDATAEAIPDGWFRTGDLATVDDDGYFFIVGRQKDLIIRGGYNVYPREIEEVLHEHQAVAEVAVIGIPHAELGEEVGAAVKLKSGMAATPAELRAFARQRVAAYKYPRHVWFVRELPKGPTGKILHREVQPPQNLLQ